MYLNFYLKMIHEIGHMFGIRHCIFFKCLMNGSMSLEEGTKKPLEFCPVCIRKLQSNVGFDILVRFVIKGILNLIKLDIRV